MNKEQKEIKNGIAIVALLTKVIHYTIDREDDNREIKHQLKVMYKKLSKYVTQLTNIFDRSVRTTTDPNYNVENYELSSVLYFDLITVLSEMEYSESVEAVTNYARAIRLGEKNIVKN